MNKLFLLLALNCIKPVVINKTNYPWNQFDQASLERAKKSCNKFYKLNKCLHIFTKVAKQDYTALCQPEVGN